MCQVLALEAGSSPAPPHGGDPGQPADRIAEAEREGWLGEIEGLQVSLAGAEDKLAQIDRRSPSGPVSLGLPALQPA